MLLPDALCHSRFQTDELSEGRPDRAIAMRGDLLPTSHPGNWTRRAFGAVDAKLVDHLSYRCEGGTSCAVPTAGWVDFTMWTLTPC